MTANNIAALVFILTSLASLTYVPFSLLNYMHYYTARGELDVDVAAVSVRQNPSSGNTEIQASLLVRNPSGYQGFSLYSDQVSLFFSSRENSSVTLFQDDPISMVETGIRPLGPHSAIKTDPFLVLSPEQSSAFAMFNSVHSGNILARVRVHIRISSFLDPVTGRVTFEKVVYIPPSMAV